jgi:hypothetical protein
LCPDTKHYDGEDQKTLCAVRQGTAHSGPTGVLGESF